MIADRPILATGLLLVTVTAAAAQTEMQTPDAFLGYELGTRFTPHHRVVAYYRHVAASAPHVTLEQYGTTYEGRPLLTAIVSSRENMARLEQIRLNNLRRTGLSEGTAVDDATAVVWLSYNVHGSESVSTEASLITLYDLANTGNSETQGWLANTVVILDPVINPDGRDRYVHWYNQIVGARLNATPFAREHREPWPGGRTNHYLFDLNRDWTWLTQRESAARVAAYRQWMPHIHVDFHEQGVNSPYYFAPAAEPYHRVITPWQREFQRTIGQNHMKYFDAQGWLYFTREVFDLLYPGYGDTYPTFNGAIGMTYEQAGGGRAGLAIVKADGDTLTLADRIARHRTTGLSTVEVASLHAGRLVAEFSRFYASAATTPPGTYKTYVVSGATDADKLRQLIRLLDAHQIAYGRAGRARTVRGFNYRRGVTENVSITTNDLVLTAYQPQAVLLGVLFEPRAEIADSVTYDITAWSLPYAYGLNAFALTDRIDPEPWSDPEPPSPAATASRPYAYLAEWKSTADVRLLAALLQQGIKVRSAREPFEVNGARYDRGTLIVTRSGNERFGADLDRIVTETAATLGQPLTPTPTGGVSEGRDFGSSSVRYLDPPHVAALAGPGLSSGAVGEIWHFFEQQIGYPVTLVNGDDWSRVDLSELDVLILPNGAYDDLFDDDGLAEIRDWIRAGGRLIALEGAVRFLVGKEGFAIKRANGDGEDEDDAGKEAGSDTAAVLRTFGERQRAATNANVPGAIYRLQVDNTHPLAFGYPDHYFTLKRNNDKYEYLVDDWNVGVIRRDGHVSGFAGSKAREQLVDALVFGVQDMGGGAVVYLVDNPLFRAFWANGKLLFANAVFVVAQ